MNPEIANLQRDIAAWEPLLEGFREAAIALEAEAQKKWDQVQHMEARIQRDMELIAELEA